MLQTWHSSSDDQYYGRDSTTKIDCGISRIGDELKRLKFPDAYIIFANFGTTQNTRQDVLNNAKSVILVKSVLQVIDKNVRVTKLVLKFN